MTHQICFHTPVAFGCIKFLKAEEIERFLPQTTQRIQRISRKDHDCEKDNRYFHRHYFGVRGAGGDGGG